jgi:hypothetical protein
MYRGKHIFINKGVLNMSIKFQKIIRFVPFVNFFVTGFSLIKVYRSSQKSQIVNIFKFGFVSFISMIVVNIPQMILQHFVKGEVFNLFLSLISAYVTLFVISSIAILQQEKYISNNDK